MTHPSDLITEALHLRRNGYSYEEISSKLKIAKSSAYSRCKGITLTEKAKERIRKRLAIGMVRAKEVLKAKRDKVLKTINDNVSINLSRIKFNKENKKLLCAFLFWGEGEKNRNSVIFVNSRKAT